MARVLGVLGLCALLASPALAAPPATLAWIGALAKIASQAGKAASAAGKAGKAGAAAAKAGKVAAGASALKGAGKLGALVAAERVFAHAAGDAARIPVFVAHADDGFRVVMAGEEIAKDAAGLRVLVGELDEMAKVADDAGVDLFVDASAVDQLASLSVGPNTRMFLANVDGPSLPLRVVDGATEVAPARGLWMKLADSSLDVAMKLGSSPADLADVVAADPGCGGEVTVVDAIAAAEPGQQVVVLDDRDPADREAWLAYAAAHDIDLVVLGLASVCEGSELSSEAIGARDSASTASTLAGLWTAAVEDVGGPIVAATELRLRLDGPALSALHRIVPEVAPGEADAVQEVDALEPPVEVLIGSVVLGLLVAVVGIRRGWISTR